jgi:hypothetical protein
MALEVARHVEVADRLPDGVIRYVDRSLAGSPRHDQGLGSK